MARDLEPKWKKCRREKYSLFNNDKWKRRPTFPGEHPASVSRPSSYAIRFREKQKVKRIYGILEKQFKRLFELASKMEGNTGVNLLRLLEMRLDNVVYRLGLAVSRMQARQMVRHGHVVVNGSKIDIPSYILKVGDEIYLKEKVKKSEFGKMIIEDSKKVKTPRWLMKLAGGGKIVSEPKREMMDRGINEQLIVEFYSR